MQFVTPNALACGIRPTVNNLLKDNQWYTQAIQTIRQKLSTGELYSIPQLLYQQLIQPNIDKIALKTTSAQAKRFKAKIMEAIPSLQQQFLQYDQEV
ncbi:MAG: hypothetical protein ACMZI2_06875 [Candidatus Symbiodolus clandestinus]